MKVGEGFLVISQRSIGYAQVSQGQLDEHPRLNRFGYIHSFVEQVYGFIVMFEFELVMAEVP